MPAVLLDGPHHCAGRGKAFARPRRIAGADFERRRCPRKIDNRGMSLSAVLLAGGESRRMRCDKATMRFEGEPLWKRQLATLRDVDAKEIFVSARRDPPWRPNDIAFVGDGDESHG